MLSIQLAPHRRARLEREVEVALRRAGPPYRTWAVIVHDSPEETRVEVRGILVFLARLEMAIKKEPVAETAAWMRECLEEAKGYHERGLLPEWVTFAEGGAELNTIEPPEGTW